MFYVLSAALAPAEHGYWFDAQQVGLRFQAGTELAPTATEARLLLWSSGDAAPRPVTLRRCFIGCVGGNCRGGGAAAAFAAAAAEQQRLRRRGRSPCTDCL